MHELKVNFMHCVKQNAVGHDFKRLGGYEMAFCILDDLSEFVSCLFTMNGLKGHSCANKNTSQFSLSPTLAYNQTESLILMNES